MGHACVTASSVGDALDHLREAAHDETPFHLIVSDVNMPLRDGYDLVQSVRDDEQLKSTKVILLTSGEVSEGTTKCEQLDVISRLMKPIKQSELFEAVVRALGYWPEPSEVTSERSPLPAAVQPLRILLAEDSLVNQKLAIGLLEKAGHKVVVVDNGRHAIQRFEAESFDLILMDIQMPTMDGLEATAEIRKREARLHTHVPIIAMTAHAMKGDRERFLGSGMDAYLAKPIRAADLYAIIGRLTSRPSHLVDTHLPLSNGQGAVTS